MSSSSDRSTLLVQSGALKAYDHEGTTVILGDDGLERRFEGDSAELVRAILELTVVPRSRDAIFARIAELAGEPVEEGGVVDEAIAALTAAGSLRAIVPAATAEARAPRKRAQIVLGITGAIASMDAPSF